MIWILFAASLLGSAWLMIAEVGSASETIAAVVALSATLGNRPGETPGLALVIRVPGRSRP